MQDNDPADIRKDFYLELQKAKDGSLVAVASTNSTDRHGEIVDNNGWDLKAYKKNPLILWAHNHDEPAIGMSAKTWVEGEGKKAQLMIKPVLHDVTERARAIKQLVEMGVIKSLSVGFRPLESPDNITFTKNELLEVSVVNVPANADAMMAYKGLKDAGFKDKTIKDLGIPTDNMDKLITVLDKVEQLEKDIEELKVVKAQQSVNPSDIKINRQRLSMNKVIARAVDKILEADKKGVDINQKEMVKVIKKANQILTVAEKDKLDG